MQIVIRIDMDNDAFQPEYEHELFRILHYLADRSATAGRYFESIMDINGNKCGEVSLIEDGELPSWAQVKGRIERDIKK